MGPSGALWGYRGRMEVIGTIRCPSGAYRSRRSNKFSPALIVYLIRFICGIFNINVTKLFKFILPHFYIFCSTSIINTHICINIYFMHKNCKRRYAHFKCIKIMRLIYIKITHNNKSTKKFK